MSSGDWTALGTILLAVVTLAAVLTTIVITAQDRLGAAQRLRDEREHSEKQLASQQDFSARQAAEERRISREREQYAQAYLVQVVLGDAAVEGKGSPNAFGDLDGSVKRLAVMVVNHSSSTITGVEARFSYDGKSIAQPGKYTRLSGFGNVSLKLREGWNPSSERALHGVLAPWDAGIRFEGDDVHVRFLKSPFPLVRWTDRWGTRWEQRRGEARQIKDGEDWVP